jgi:hydroxyacylglutathione hydrolase
MKVLAVPAFQDNYLWVLHNTAGQAWVVDPGDAAPVEAALAAHNLSLEGILITHHHFDHTGGALQLAEGVRPIYGPEHSPFEGITHPLEDGARIQLGEAAFEVLAVPGHTLDHIAYYNATEGLLFCGDTLFAGGCGRLFEGTAEQMHGSLQRLAALPDATEVYCAHEYTLANLRFAVAVEPENEALLARQQAAEALRARGEATVPSTIGLERATNPFLRAEAPAVHQALIAEAGPALLAAPACDRFGALRSWKDRF